MNTSKKIFIFCYFSIVSCFAQTEKGQILTGINAAKYFGNVSHFSINFDAGYFLSDNVVMGLNTRLSDSDFSSQSSSYSIAPFVKCYILNGPTKLFLQSSVGFGKSRNSLGIVNSDESVTYFRNQSSTYKTFAIGPGISIFFKKKFAIEFLAGYRDEKSTINVGAIVPDGVVKFSDRFYTSIGFVKLF